MWNCIKYTLFPILSGIVLGMLLASVTKNVAALSWLSYGLSFGMQSPFTLDLKLIEITLGLSLNLNVATIICITAAMIIAKYCFRR